jgi:hypothetical protein
VAIIWRVRVSASRRNQHARGACAPRQPNVRCHLSMLLLFALAFVYFVSFSKRFLGVRFRPGAALNGTGCTFVIQPVSSPWVVPVRKNWLLMDRVQAFSGVWASPGTMRWMALGMKDFTSSPHFGGEAGSVSPETSTAGTSKRNGSK